MAGKAHAAAYRTAATLYRKRSATVRLVSIADIYQVDPDMMVNIEHEDTELGRVEGVEVLKAAEAALRADLVS